MIHRTAIRVTLGLVVAMLVAGCGGKSAEPASPPRASAKPLKAISIISSPCMGDCASYTVVLFADGKGVFTGTPSTAVKGEHVFPLNPDQFAAVAKILSPYRPVDKRIIEEDAPGECKHFATDFPTKQVIWSATDGTRQTLAFDTGCIDSAYKALAEALDASVAAPPVAALIGKHGNPLGSTIVK